MGILSHDIGRSQAQLGEHKRLGNLNRTAPRLWKWYPAESASANEPPVNKIHGALRKPCLLKEAEK